MKLFAFVAVLGFASAAQLPNSYIPPPSNAGSAGGAGFLQSPGRPINQYLPPGQQSGFKQGTFSGNQFGGGAAQGAGGFSGQGGHSGGGFGGQQGGGHSGGGFGGQQGGGHSAGGFGGQQGGYSGGGQQYRPQGPSGPQIPIIRYNNVPNSGDGSYQFDYETGNGIMQREEGHLNNEEQVVQGEYSYTGDDGQLYKVQYKADGNGFQAVGDHLPTPPPIPEAILKSLAINAAAQASGQGQSGQYQGGQQGGYSSGGQQGGYSSGGQQGGYSSGGQQGGRPHGGAGGAGGFGGQGQQPFQPSRPSFNSQTGYTY